MKFSLFNIVFAIVIVLFIVLMIVPSSVIRDLHKDIPVNQVKEIAKDAHKLADMAEKFMKERDICRRDLQPTKERLNACWDREDELKAMVEYCDRGWKASERRRKLR